MAVLHRFYCIQIFNFLYIFFVTASAASFFPSVYKPQDSKTPTTHKSSSVPGVGRTRPRTLQLGREEKKNTPTDTSQRQTQTRTSLGNRRDLSEPTSRGRDQKLKSSRLSVPLLNKLENIQEPRRASSGTNLSKSKSTSLHSLSFEKEKTPKESGRPRSKWSTSKMASFASVPNLLISDDEDEFPASAASLRKSSELSNSVPDVNDEAENKPVKQTSRATSNETSSYTKRRSVQPAEKRSASTSRLSGGTAKALVEEKKPMFRKVGASVSSVKNTKAKHSDRDLMPPPAVTNIAKTKPETKFVKRAQQARRKTTSDITLEEAKDILKGNSGILNGGDSKPNSRKSSLSSLSPPNVQHQTRPKSANDKDDLSQITDPKFLDVASEIEQTAAEIRRQSGSQYSNLDVSPHDPPEHDIPPEKDIPNLGQRNPADNTRYSLNDSKAGVHINVDIEPMSKLGNSLTDSEKPNDNGTTQDDDFPSPSVKERIAKLNKKVSDVDPSSPRKERLGSQSPVLDIRRASSPRITSSTQINFSLSRNEIPSPQTSSLTPSSTSSVLVTNSESAPSKLNTSQSSQSFQPIPFDTGNEVNLSQTEPVKPVTVSAITPITKGTSNYSIDSMRSSEDSDGLQHHLSPGSYQSNHSPQSGIDTGLGSDTDTDFSNR